MLVTAVSAVVAAVVVEAVVEAMVTDAPSAAAVAAADGTSSAPVQQGRRAREGRDRGRRWGEGGGREGRLQRAMLGWKLAPASAEVPSGGPTALFVTAGVSSGWVL